MAQADYIISNQTFPNTRADINSHLQAIATNNSGTSAPTTQYAGQFWIDTTSSTWTLYIHDGSDDIQFATIDTSANTVNFVDSALDVVTDSSPQLGGNLDLNSNNITGTGNINITGTATVTGLTTTGDINLGDNDKIKLGASNDLQIYHNGSKSLIYDSGAGDLEIRATNILVADSDGTSLIYGQDNGALNLYHNGSNKLQTTSGGVNITGNLTASGNLTSLGIDDNATSTAITIDSSENVGIGTVTPNAITGYGALTIAGSTGGFLDFEHGSTLNSSIVGVSSGLSILTRINQPIIFSVNVSERMRLTTTGLGIGTSSPTQKLDIDTGHINFSNNYGIDWGGNNSVRGSATDNRINFKTNGSERMRIDSSGNVGIGETSPVGKLHIKSADSGTTLNTAAGQLFLENSGNAGMTIGSGTSSLGLIYFADSDDDNVGRIEYSHSENSMRFWTNDAERMRILSDGQHQLTGVVNSTLVEAYNDHASSPFGYNILFRNASPDNNANYFLNCGDSTTARARIESDGDLQNHDNSYGSISDERIKQDIRDSNSQWNDIKNIRVRNFKKKDDVRQYGENAWEQIGVVAQELETVSPRLIKHSDPTPSDILSDSSFGTLYQEGDEIPEGKNIGDVKEVHQQVKSVSYSVLYMKAIKALQEAIERIETLEAKVQTLENNQP